MNLYVAQHFLIQDRSDWTKPHLNWLPPSLYRSFFNTGRFHGNDSMTGRSSR